MSHDFISVALRHQGQCRDVGFGLAQAFHEPVLRVVAFFHVPESQSDDISDLVEVAAFFFSDYEFFLHSKNSVYMGC